jgi:hypothetical protein
MSFRSSVSVGIATVVCAFLSSLAIGVLAVASNRWFGSGDLFPFGVYCIPFALLTWPLTSLFSAVTRKCWFWFALPLAFFVGLLYGYAGTYSVALFLGPWFGAMSVPMLRVWCAAGALTFAAAVLLRRRGVGIRAMVGILVIIAGAITLFFALRPALSLATEDQHLTVVLLRYHPGEAPLTISDPFSALEGGDIDLLKRTELRGTVETRGTHASNSSDWPRARALVIFTGALDEVSIPQPKHCTIAYMQIGDGFREIPPDAPTFARTIQFHREAGEWYIEVQHASGARSGGYINP